MTLSVSSGGRSERNAEKNASAGDGLKAGLQEVLGKLSERDLVRVADRLLGGWSRCGADL